MSEHNRVPWEQDPAPQPPPQASPQLAPQPAQSRGQLSEVVRLDPAWATTPISDDQAVAGYPLSESGAPDEPEEAGPNARTGSSRTGNSPT